MPYRLPDRADDDTLRPGGTAGLAEPVRLHPYYGQRIFVPVRPLADVAADVGAHHERLDGSGYPVGLCRPGVPLGARLLAAADTWPGGPVTVLPSWIPAPALWSRPDPAGTKRSRA